MRGLHDHRRGIAVVTHARQQAEAVEIGHHKIEHDAIEAALAAREQTRSLVAALGHDRVVAELANHVFEQPALNRIVIDDENAFGHGNPITLHKAVPISGQCRSFGLTRS